MNACSEKYAFLLVQLPTGTDLALWVIAKVCGKILQMNLHDLLQNLRGYTKSSSPVLAFSLLAETPLASNSNIIHCRRGLST